MKELLFVLALAVAAVQNGAAVDGAKNFRDCMRELGLTFGSQEFDTKFVCINVCEYEKAGLVANGKYLEHKYTEQYMNNFPKAGPLQLSILTECIREANKEVDKCDVGRSLQNCEMKHHSVLYEETRKDEVNNEIKKDN